MIYLPPDTVLSEEFEAKLFAPDAKIKLHKRRIKAIKIRGKISQGMIIDPAEYPLDYVVQNVSKYEPPVAEMPRNMQVKKVRPDLKAFVRYSDIENFRYYDRIIQDGEEVDISLKVHGTNWRGGWFKSEANTRFQKVLKFLRLMPKWTFAWGSRTVQIQAKLIKRHQGFKSEEQGVNFGDVYTEMVHKYDLKTVIPQGYALYGEVYGSGIQKGYKYDAQGDEHKLVIFDIYNVEEKRYLNKDEFDAMMTRLHIRALTINGALLPTAPTVYRGPYSKEILDKHIAVNVLGTEVNEGVVIKPVVERSSPALSRVILKVINPEYHLQKTTDFH